MLFTRYLSALNGILCHVRYCLLPAVLLFGLLPEGRADLQVTKVGDSVVDAEALTIRGGFGQCINGLAFQQDAVATHKDHQYVAYYDAARRVCLARRKLPAGDWQVVRFGDYAFKSNDAHNTISLGICPKDGTIHLAFDHHGHPLHYRVSQKGAAAHPKTVAWEASGFGPISSELEKGKPIRITYPRFWQTPDGGLQFCYRQGGSGSGDRMLVDYAAETGTWIDTRQIDSRAGLFQDHLGKSGTRCSYPNGYDYGPRGNLHATWVWRESSQGANHDLMYCYSRDRGKTWRNNRGEPLPGPPGVGSPGVKVVDISRALGLMNTHGQAVDSRGRIHAVMWHCTDQSLQAAGSKPGQHRWGPPEARRYHLLADYRRTAADLVAANYYGRLRELTIKGGMRGTHPESGGPFFTHWIDALQCEGINDIPMGEFWKRNVEPNGSITWHPNNNPTVKQVACVAHIYGKPVCQAEAFTAFAPDWTATPWNMKDIGDEAFCHGLTRYVLCFWVHQPRLDAKPGHQWVHVGTHFDPNITWWDMSHGWLRYVARCQHMLRQGLFVADFAYFRGEDIPGFIAPRNLQQPMRPAGFDYDALNAEVLLNRAAAKDGRLVLPDGMSYRYLVLPHGSPWTVSPAVLQKIKELATAGVTIIGARPAQTPGLTNYPQCDQQVKELANALWGPEAPTSGNRKAGSGRVIWGHSLAEVVQMDGLAPDVEFRDVSPQARLDWIHRRDGNCEIYFLSNLAAVPATAEVVFRAGGKQPELWDAVTGQIRDLPDWREEDARAVVPLTFAPRESYFLVFRKNAAVGSSKDAKNFPEQKPVAEIAGPWQVSFDPKWGGPESVVFEKLDDWSKRPEEGIRYYSGTATYRQTFDLPETSRGANTRIYLDLGRVKNLATVRLNGKDLGVVWTAPWRVEITDAVKPTGNRLEIDVVNLWPNRLIGDAALPPEKRHTVTNVQTYKKDSPLLESGLLGPVSVMEMQ